jgi:hypothetical protein
MHGKPHCQHAAWAAGIKQIHHQHLPYSCVTKPDGAAGSCSAHCPGGEQQSIDEHEVRQHLLTLVAGHKSVLQGCFLVDQLVFEELMHASGQH